MAKVVTGAPSPFPKILWEPLEIDETFIGPPCPDACEAGPASHKWRFTWSAFDGSSLSTDECPICDRGVNQTMSDWPHDYLTIELDVTLEPITDAGGTWETPEFDHYVVMHPVTP